MLRATITLLLLMAVSFGLAEPARAETAVRELTSHREAQLIADLSQRHQMNQNAANEQKFDAGRDHALKRVTSSRPTVPEYDYGKNKMPASFSLDPPTLWGGSDGECSCDKRG